MTEKIPLMYQQIQQLVLFLWYIFMKRCLPIAIVTILLYVVVHRCWSSLHRYNARRRRQKQQQSNTSATNNNNGKDNNPIPRKSIAFFHPYCTGGGGGERVLWKMIQILLHNERVQRFYDPTIIVYTVDIPTSTYKQDVQKHVYDRFGISLSDRMIEDHIQFVHLHDYKNLLQPSPYLSLLVESINTMILSYIAFYRTISSTSTTAASSLSISLPDIYIDTTGCAFTYIIATLLFKCHVIAYVHYPTISTDMLQLVWDKRRITATTRVPTSNSNTTTTTTAAPAGTYNHPSYISSSMIFTYIKLLYYMIFALLYGCVGSCTTLVFVNSTWTFNHINSLWIFPSIRKRISILYPPCSLPPTSTTTNSAATSKQQPPMQRLTMILSIGQFRPEKDHTLQIMAMEQYLKLYYKDDILSNNISSTAAIPQLICIGGCRNGDDEQRLRELQQLTKSLGITNHVQFIVNQPYSVLEKYLCQSSIGIHTMWNEHFGIGIVEMMAAGLIVIAHNSGGPKSDIVVPYNGNTTTNTATTIVSTITGYLATTIDEYANCIHKAFSLNINDESTVRQNAIHSSKRFTDDVFAESFELAMIELYRKLR